MSREDGFSSGAGGVSLAGVPRALSDLTPANNVLISTGEAKPWWMLTRFPVSVEEYRELNVQAQEPDPGALSPDRDALTEDSSTEIAGSGDQDLLPENVDPYEDVPQDTAAISNLGEPAAAPTIEASFEATAQTAFRPPGNSLAVGPNDALVAANVDLAGYGKDGSFRFRWPSMTALFSPVHPDSRTNLFATANGGLSLR